MARKLASDSWERGSPYEQYVGRWSCQVASLFLSWLNMPAGRRWLHVGCGTGALSAAILDGCSPSLIAGVEPSAGFLKTAKENLGGRAALYQGSALALPLANASVDVVVSGLVLNFVSDQPAAVLEMTRVTRQGGAVARYVWDYAGKMELMRFFWDAAVALDPNATRLDEGVRFPLCRHLFHPLGRLTVELFQNGDVRHGRGWRRAVPMLLTRRKPDHVARPNFFDRAAPSLGKTAAGGYDQGLAQWMGVPCSACTRLERDTDADDARRRSRLEQGIDAHTAGKVFGRPFAGWQRATACDVHV